MEALKYKEILLTLRQQIIKDLLTDVNQVGIEIEFNTHLVINEIDDQFSYCIIGINVEDELLIDSNKDSITFDEVTIYELVTMLEMVQKGEYEVVEEKSEE